VQHLSALDSCLIDGGFHVQQQFFPLFGPSLLKLLIQEDQFAQMVHITQAVLTGVAPIGLPAIMHAHAMEVCQDADGIQRFVTPFDMHPIVRQLLGRPHMHPVAFARYVQSRLILMQHRCLRERGFDLRFDRRETLGTALYQRL